MLNLLLGQIPEAIYFALFMIYTKQLKEKRLLYITLMVVEYILLIKALPFNIWFQILYTFISFLILKILYKEKSQLTDIFTFAVGSIILMIVSSIAYIIIYNTTRDLNTSVVLHSILLFIEPVNFYLVMNQGFNDYRDVFGDNLDTYIRYTEAFICDEDAKPNKVLNYFL